MHHHRKIVVVKTQRHIVNQEVNLLKIMKNKTNEEKYQKQNNNIFNIHIHAF